MSKDDEPITPKDLRNNDEHREPDFCKIAGTFRKLDNPYRYVFEIMKALVVTTFNTEELGFAFDISSVNDEILGDLLVRKLNYAFAVRGETQLKLGALTFSIIERKMPDGLHKHPKAPNKGPQTPRAALQLSIKAKNSGFWDAFHDIRNRQKALNASRQAEQNEAEISTADTSSTVA